MKPADSNKISVFVGTRNEEENIHDCLASVQWSDDVWVIDSFSTDRTKEIARQFPNVKVVDFHYDGGWPKKKFWSLQNIKWKHDWVLILDADERVTDELRDEMLRAVRTDAVVAYYLRWKFYFLGRWLKNCWNHGWMLRLVRKGKAEYENLGMSNEGGWDSEVHENLIAFGETAFLNNYLIHENKKDLFDWIKKHNEYSTWAAALRTKDPHKYEAYKVSDLFSTDHIRRRKYLNKLLLKLPLKPCFIFCYLYFWKRGFLDGREGFYFCVCHAIHRFQIELKVYEKKKRKKDP